LARSRASRFDRHESQCNMDIDSYN
jgi:hypothetical protein